MALSESASKKLEALYLKYRTSLPEKISQVKAAFDKSRDEDYSAKSLKDLEFIVHNLAGSAAMHGFNQVSTCARVMDKHIGQDKPMETSDAVWQQDLQKYYDELAEAITVATEEEGSVPA